MNTVEPYTEIAPIYDSLLRHVDYQEWYEYLVSLLKHYIPRPRHVLELGCGTGRFGAKFSNNGYAVFGIDKSLEMLRVARSRAFFNFRILCADMRNFYVAKKFDFIFSVHDTVNYLLEETDIMKMFSCVREAMSEDGVFMFDVTTEHNIYKNFDRKTARYRIQESFVEWSNSYDPVRKIVSSTIRVKRKDAISAEEHLQRIYSVDEIRRLLTGAGFVLDGVYGDFTFLPPGEGAVMINFIARRS
jgi:predicted TPR repeat methyltransferase